MLKNYKKVSSHWSEAELEHEVRSHPELIEEGLVYVDHQIQTGEGRLDVLLVDSGKEFVVAELKVVQDDAMLFQAIDYFEYVQRHREAFARLYHDKEIDPAQNGRLMLIAPSFSLKLINRCKWINIPILLVTYQCLQFEGESDVVPIFTEQPIPFEPPPPVVTTIAGHLDYITDPSLRSIAATLIESIPTWKPDAVTLDAIKYSISLRICGRVFGYFTPYRKQFVIETYDPSDEWLRIPVKDSADLEKATEVLREVMERKSK